ncbi:AraC family transcriptional regulator [Sinomicrobium soli]|uniref:AraC family transcriptional regulator n=1 Tax=Sinomicrobium sp. N-1-3-6 TaxID=2219864 RepID=UPI000DCEA5BE|nr:helix-turn-helix domain-containing protein [Sinomicrobium sp. N-1-3-6]RAV28919.1 hypothetical protein DN748_11015 [Sinomicrobium sp. N-1-3-6]
MMKRYKQFDSLVINDFTTSVWEHPLHNHNHYEFIFIAGGKGMHHLNKRLLPYQKGCLYLLGPEDEHEFLIDEETHFVYFKFTKLYLDSFRNEDAGEWNRDIDILLKIQEHKRGNLLTDAGDMVLTGHLFEIIAEEYRCNHLLSKKIIFQLFKSIILVVKRNKVGYGIKTGRDTMPGITGELLEYIELHIYEPKMLTKKEIAGHFHYSPHYIGAFFKEKIGTSLKDYIRQYRYTLLEQRLKHGHHSTKQLALEFGFTDESHLHKFVKAFSGQTFSALKAKYDQGVPETISLPQNSLS